MKKAKRYLALLLTLVMVFQVIGTGLAFADGELPAVTITYTDVDGVEHEMTVPADGIAITDDGLYVVNDFPEGAVVATVQDNDDIQLTLEVKGDVELKENQYGYYDDPAVVVKNNTNATIDGDVVGGVGTENTRVDIVNESTYQDGVYHERHSYEYTPSDSTMTINGDVTPSGDSTTAVTAKGESTITVNENANGALSASGDSQINVNGNVNSDTGYSAAISTSKEVASRDYEYSSDEGTIRDETTYREANAKIEVAGNVTNASGGGISTTNDSHYDHDKDELVEDVNHSQIKVGGDLTAYTYGVSAGGESTVDIGGNLVAGHEYETQDYYWNEDGEYVPYGDPYTKWTGTGVTATETSVVTIGGDLTSEETAITAKDKTNIEVKGDVASKHGSGISATDTEHYDYEDDKWTYDKNESTIKVDGNLTAYNDGISASGASKISIGGILSAGHGYETQNYYWNENDERVPSGDPYTTWTGSGITSMDTSVVTIGGDLTSERTAITAKDKTNIEVKGDVASKHGSGISATDTEHYDYENDKWIYSKNESTIKVGGSLTSYDTGISASGTSQISVGGSLTSYNTGVSASGKSDVNVGGNVTSGHSYEEKIEKYNSETGKWYYTGETRTRYSGYGIEASGESTINVGGKLTSEQTAITTSNNEKITDQKTVKKDDGTETVTTKYEKEGSKTTISVAGDVTSNHGNGVQARGESTVTIGGSLKSEGDAVSATGSSKVEISGSATSTAGNGITTGLEHAKYTSTRTYSVDENGNRRQISSEDDYEEDRDGAVVTVGGDLAAYNTGISASGKSSVSVGGNVVAGHEEERTSNYTDEYGNRTQEKYIEYYGNGVKASDSATVTVGGNVTSENTAISAENRQSSTSNKTTDAETGITTNIRTEKREANQSVINVDGDVTSKHGSGVNANGQSSVTIKGSLTSENGAVNAKGSSKVNVGGDVKSTSGTGISAGSEYGESINTEVYKVNEDGSRTWISDKYEYEEKRDGATVTVGGNLTAYNTGINASGESTVTVGGNVTAGHEKQGTRTKYVNGEDVQENYIYGSGQGVSAFEKATVAIGGKLTSEGTAITTSNNEKTTDKKTVKNNDGTETVTTKYEKEGSKAQISIAGDVTSNHGNGVEARGESTVTIGGSLKSEGDAVSATGTSKVEISGSATSTKGNGITTDLEHAKYTSSTVYEIDEYGNRHYISSKQDYEEDRDGAVVSIGGDLTAYNTGINASGKSEVVVGGDVTTGHEYEYEETEWDPETERSVPTGKKAIGYEGSGVIASDNAKVTIGGNLTAEETAINAESNNYEWTYEYEEIENADGTKTYVRKGTKTEKETNNPVVDVAGDVTSKHGWTAVAANEEATIKIGGSVNGEHDGIRVTGDAAVTVGGDVTTEDGIAIVSNKESLGYTNTSTYDSDGNYISGEYKEKYGNAGTVEVGGDVTAKNNTAIDMTGKSKVIAWGDITGGYVEEEEEEQKEQEEERELTPRQQAYEDALAEAFSDVEKLEKTHRGAISIRLDEEDNDGLLIVGGTVKANEGNVPVVLNYTLDNPDAVTEMPELSDMKIYEIAPNGGEYFDVNIYLKRDFEYTYVDEETGKEVTQKTSAGQYVELSEEDHAAVVEAIAKSIQYIIKLNAINGSIELNGATYDEEYGVYTAHEEDEVSVTVRPDDGFELDSLTATGQYTLIDNGDGTWTLIIHRGGGVTLTATISERSIQPPAPVEEESEPTPPPFTHPALYKIVKFGHYDFDGDGTAEELEWKIFYVTNGYAKMALVNRVDEIPEDFATTAFSDEEKEAIKDNEEGAKDITMLDEETAKRVFNEQDSEQKHITMWVKLSALVY